MESINDTTDCFTLAMLNADEHVERWVSNIARKVPGVTAIEWRNQRWSYREIDSQANFLANWMIGHNATPSSRWIILSTHIPKVVIATLAALKAGAIFVPLDPCQPSARLQDIIDCVKPDILITHYDIWSSIEGINLPGSCLLTGVDDSDDDIRAWNRLTHQAACPFDEVLNAESVDEKPVNGKKVFDEALLTSVPPELDIAVDAPCYIYFTSGTTRQPKGIVGQVKAISHFIHWELSLLKPHQPLRISQLTSPAFDAFLRDIFVPLCSGGTLCVPETRDSILNVAYLREWLNNENINILHTVPSIFTALVKQQCTAEDFADLTHVLLAGEVLPSSVVRTWFEVFGSRIQLFNLYGPSETTMVKFCHKVHQDDADGVIPIGSPIPGAAALLLDDHLQPVAGGDIGEIYIRTPYRSLGYFQQPVLTAEVFIQNPFSDQPGDIIYKTGDLAKQDNEGSFLFIGRKDQQVKLHGIRIEPSEIENRILEIPSVSEVVCKLHTESLCAYVVARDSISIQGIKSHLRKQIPYAMIPSHIELLEQMPRTITGKLDRRSLYPSFPDASEDSEVNISETEKKLIAIWREVLERENVSRTDNFFIIGGNSLHAMGVISRIMNQFNISIPINLIFDTPVLMDFSSQLDERIRQATIPTEEVIL